MCSPTKSHSIVYFYYSGTTCCLFFSWLWSAACDWALAFIFVRHFEKLQMPIRGHVLEFSPHVNCSQCPKCWLMGCSTLAFESLSFFFMLLGVSGISELLFHCRLFWYNRMDPCKGQCIWTSDLFLCLWLAGLSFKLPSLYCPWRLLQICDRSVVYSCLQWAKRTKETLVQLQQHSRPAVKCHKTIAYWSVTTFILLMSLFITFYVLKNG